MKARDIIDLLDREMPKHVGRKTSGAALLGLAMFRAAIAAAIDEAHIGDDGATEVVDLDDLRALLTEVESAQWAAIQVKTGGQ